MRFLPAGTAMVVASALVSVAGCSRTAPTAVAGGTALALRLNQPAAPTSGAPVVNLVRVEDDSRCPVDVTCVWAGNAVVVLTVSTGGSQVPAQQFVNTGIEPRSVVVAPYRITLDSLLPHPRSGQPIAQGDYVAWVSVYFMPDA